MDIFAVELDYNDGGGGLQGAFLSLDDAMEFADRVEYGDYVSVTRCNPEPREYWIRPGYNRDDMPADGVLCYAHRSNEDFPIANIYRKVPTR